jgi:hypothetical protein
LALFFNLVVLREGRSRAKQMADIFLSFSKQRNIWKRKFVETSLLGTKLRVLDYEDRPVVAGNLDDELDARIELAAGFVALIDEAYTKSTVCVREFEFAVDRFGIDSKKFGAVVLDTPGRDFVKSRFEAHPGRIYVDLADAGGGDPRDLDEERDVRTIRHFAQSLIDAILPEILPTRPVGTRPVPRPPRVIVLGVPYGGSSTGIATLRQQLMQGLKNGGIDAAQWNDDWVTSGPSELVKKALSADHPPMFVLPLDRSFAAYYQKTTLQGFVRTALGGLANGGQRQLPKCVVWCPENSPPGFGGDGTVVADSDDALRNDSQIKLIEWLRAELGIATWKTAVISVEGLKVGDKSAANKIGWSLKDILVPAVRDICRPPEPVLTSFYSFEEKTPKTVRLEAELGRQLKQFVGSGVAILTVHDLALNVAPDWPTAYNALQQKISRYQRLLNRITDQNLLNSSRIVKIAIVMTNREFKVGPDIYADDDKVAAWKVIGMSDRGDGTIEVEPEDSAMFTDAVCSVVSTL